MAILDLAEWGIGNELPDVENIVAGWAYLLGDVELPRSAFVVDTFPWAKTVVVTLQLTTAMDWERLKRTGLVPADAIDEMDARVRPVFRDAGRLRGKWPSPVNIIRALAIHYLSKAGSGERSLEDAAQLYSERFPHLYLDEQGRPKAWDVREHHALLSQLRDEWGPLSAAEFAA